ncbi:MAG: hypothetical protein ACLT20_11600 [Lachnospiraceae bacterium]
MLARAPIAAAVAAMGTGLLNIMENPNTPQKLVSSRRISKAVVLRWMAIKSTGCSFRISAMIQANMVATRTMITE